MKPAALKAARKKLKLSLDRLSEDVGISVSQLSRFENGQRVPRVPELERIAARLGVTPEYLLGVRTIETPKADLMPTPPQAINEQQALVVRTVCRAFLGWLMAEPSLREKMQDAAYQAAVARLISQYAKSQRLHDAILRDGEAALVAIQTALELQLDEVN